MAEQTITISAARLVTDSDTQKRWDFSGDNAILIDEELRDTSGFDRFLRRLICETDSNGFEFRMIMGRTGTWPTGTGGDDLATEWEDSEDALGFSQGSNEVASVPGPNYSGNYQRDTADTYIWIIATGSVATACESFFFTDLDTSADFSLTFRTPTAGPVAHAIDGGDISWVFDLPVPTATHVTAAGTIDHEVSGGDINWLFNLPRPTATHTQLFAP